MKQVLVTRDRLQGLLVRFAVATLRVFASLLLALTALPVLGAESIRVVETHAVSAEPPSGTAAPSHELRPTLYLFQGARWLPDEAVTGLWEAMELLEPCGIVLARRRVAAARCAEKIPFLLHPGIERIAARNGGRQARDILRG